MRSSVPAPTDKLVDGEHVYLECSACNKPLVDIYITRPDAVSVDGKPFIWKVRAKCCYGCMKNKKEAEMSFTKEIRGMFHHGGITKPNPNDAEDATIITSISNLTVSEQDSIPIITYEVVANKNG